MGLKLKERKCERCGSSDSRVLTRHRIVPGWIGGAYHPDNIKILCRNCHSLTHLEKNTRKVSAPVVIKHSADRPAECMLGDKFWTYSLHWYKLEFDDTKEELWVGVCGCSNRVFDFEAHPLMNIFSLIADDVIISEKKGCENKLRCLVTKCKYNKTTLESFAEHKMLKEGELVWSKKNWNRITNLRPVRALCRSLGLRPYR